MIPASMSKALVHDVFVVFLQLAQFPAEVQSDLEVQVTRVAHVRLHLEDALDLLALLDGQ